MAVWWPIRVGAHIRKVTIVIGINWHFCWQRQLRGWRLNGLSRVNYPLILGSGPPRAEMRHRSRALWAGGCCPSSSCSANTGHQFVVLSVWHLAWWVLNLLKWTMGLRKAKGPQSKIMRGISGHPPFLVCFLLNHSWSGSYVICSNDWLHFYRFFCFCLFVFLKHTLFGKAKAKDSLKACSKTLLNKPPRWLFMAEN